MVTAICGLLAISVASANVADPVPRDMIGSGIVLVPVYPGAETYHFHYFPMLRLGPVAIDGTGLRLVLVHWHYLDAGPMLGYTGGRNEDDDTRLRGMGNIDASLGAGAFVRLHKGPVNLVASARQAFTQRDNGLTAALRANLSLPLSNGILLSLGPDLDFGNAHANQTWFGVSATQSTSSGLPEYAVRSGIQSVGMHAVLNVPLARHLLLTSFVNVRSYRGAVRRSPLMQQTTATQMGLGAAYLF